MTPLKSQLTLGTHFMALGHLTKGLLSAWGPVYGLLLLLLTWGRLAGCCWGRGCCWGYKCSVNALQCCFNCAITLFGHGLVFTLFTFGLCFWTFGLCWTFLVGCWFCCLGGLATGAGWAGRGFGGGAGDREPQHKYRMFKSFKITHETYQSFF